VIFMGSEYAMSIFSRDVFVRAALNNGMPMKEIERGMEMVEHGGYIVVGDGQSQVSFYNIDKMPRHMLTEEEKMMDACCKAVVYDGSDKIHRAPIAVYYWGARR